MYKETITESTHGEYDIFNEHSGQSYVVSYDVWTHLYLKYIASL